MDFGLRISSLVLRRAPGFPEGLPFTFKPGSGLTVIHGPNGSGKTTTSLAAQALLWPTTQEMSGLSLRGEFEYEGNVWSVDLSRGVSKIQRSGQEDHHPVDLPSTARGRYNLGLHELIRADNRSFAEALKKESSGGFDLQASLERLGYELKAPRKGSAAYNNFKNAFIRLNQARAAQEGLRNQEQELRDLQKTLEQVRADQAELTRLRNALRYIQAKEALKMAELDLAAFGEGMFRISGQETDRLDRIGAKLQAENQELEKASAEVVRAEGALADLGLPPQGIDPVFLEALKTGIEELRTLDGQAGDLEKELAGAVAETVQERRRLGLGADDHRLDNVDLSNINDLADLARRAEQVRAGRKAKEALESWLGRDQEGPDPDSLKEGLKLLLEWLLDVEGESSSRAALWKLLVFVGGGLAGAGLVLAWWQHWGWIGAALAGLLLLLWPALPRTSTSFRTSIQNRFQRLDLTPPDSWTPPEVRRTAERLWKEAAQAELSRQKRIKWEGLKEEREGLLQQEAELAERRAQTASLLGIKPNLDEAVLFSLVESLSRFQAGLDKQTRVQAALSLVDQNRRKLAADLAASLSSLGYPDLPDVPRIQAAVKNLDQRARNHELLKTEIQHSGQKREEARSRIAALEKEQRALFENLGLGLDEEHVLRQWVGSLPTFEAARDRLSSARRDGELAQEGIDPQSGLLVKPVFELENLIREKENSAARLDRINQQIGSLGQKLDSAKQSHDLEEALAHLENCKENLRQEREGTCRAVVGHVLGRYLENKNKAESMPRVFARAREYFRLFTKGAFVLDFDSREPEFRGIDTAANLGRSLDQLSSGTRVQLLMAVRLAFVEDHEKGPKLPLFLDEALANSDPERTEAVMESACRILKTGRQIFYFTARPSEVSRWQSLLQENGLEPPIVLDLEELKAEGRYRKHPLRRIPLSRRPEPPSPRGLSREEYGDLLKVPEFDPTRQEIGQTHIWHFLENQEMVHQALCAGYKQWGSFRNMLQAGALPFLAPDQPAAKKALAAARALEEAAKLWRVGRGCPVTLDHLINGGVSSTFLDKVAELNQAVGGDAGRLIAGLKSKKVKRFQAAAITNLEEHLEEIGCLDSRPRLTRNQVLEKVLLALAREQQEGLIDPDRAAALISRLNFDNPPA